MIKTNVLHAKFVFDEARSLKALGVAWCARNDKIYYSVQPLQFRKNKQNEIYILSEIAKIFD